MSPVSRYIIKDRDEFFTAAQRSMIVWQILRRTRYDDAHPDKIGIVRLLSSGAYKAAYPLHDGKFTEGDSDRRVRASLDQHTVRVANHNNPIVDSLSGVGEAIKMVQKAASLDDQTILW